MIRLVSSPICGGNLPTPTEFHSLAALNFCGGSAQFRHKLQSPVLHTNLKSSDEKWGCPNKCARPKLVASNIGSYWIVSTYHRFFWTNPSCSQLASPLEHGNSRTWNVLKKRHVQRGSLCRDWDFILQDGPFLL